MMELLSGMAILIAKYIFGGPEFQARQRAIRAEILQEHREGITKAIHGKVFEKNLENFVEAIELLGEAKNRAEKFDKKLYVDINQSLKDVHFLMQNQQFLFSPDLSRESREKYSTQSAQIKCRLLTKLNNLD